jgi:hypothetical protein
MSIPSYDPTVTCDPNPHIVVANLSGIHFEARLAGEVSRNTAVGIGTDPETAIANLCDKDPRAIGLPSDVRDDPFA